MREPLACRSASANLKARQRAGVCVSALLRARAILQFAETVFAYSGCPPEAVGLRTALLSGRDCVQFCPQRLGRTLK